MEPELTGMAEYLIGFAATIGVESHVFSALLSCSCLTRRR
jgi:hypothetical protein